MAKGGEDWAKLVPELVVTDIDASLAFWCDLIGFSLVYSRSEHGFAYLDLEGAQIMLEQYDESDKEWLTAPLEIPFGRGINFQIEVESVDPIIDRLTQVGWILFVPAEQRWYRVDEMEFGQRQFLVKDPDGYLLRLIEHLGERRPTHQ